MMSSTNNKSKVTGGGKHVIRQKGGDSTGGSSGRSGGYSSGRTGVDSNFASPVSKPRGGAGSGQFALQGVAKKPHPVKFSSSASYPGGNLYKGLSWDPLNPSFAAQGLVGDKKWTPKTNVTEDDSVSVGSHKFAFRPEIARAGSEYFNMNQKHPFELQELTGSNKKKRGNRAGKNVQAAMANEQTASLPEDLTNQVVSVYNRTDDFDSLYSLEANNNTARLVNKEAAINVHGDMKRQLNSVTDFVEDIEKNIISLGFKQMFNALKEALPYLYANTRQNFADTKVSIQDFIKEQAIKIAAEEYVPLGYTTIQGDIQDRIRNIALSRLLYQNGWTPEVISYLKSQGAVSPKFLEEAVNTNSKLQESSYQGDKAPFLVTEAETKEDPSEEAPEEVPAVGVAKEVTEVEVVESTDQEDEEEEEEEEEYCFEGSLEDVPKKSTRSARACRSVDSVSTTGKKPAAVKETKRAGQRSPKKVSDDTSTSTVGNKNKGKKSSTRSKYHGRKP